MRKTHLLLVSTLTLFALAAPVFANPQSGQRRMRARIEAHVDDALDQIKANPQQRVAIRSAVEELGSALHANRAERVGKLADAAVLFTADKLDAQKVAELRAYHDREAEKLSDAAIQAIFDVHAALTPVQRKALVEYVQQELPQSSANWRQKFFVNLIDYRLDEVLDQLMASPDQRKKISAIKDSVADAWFAGKSDRRSMLNAALALFPANDLDKKKIADLRAGFLAKHKMLADRIEAAVREIHATLSPEQRRAAIDLARAHHRRKQG